MPRKLPHSRLFASPPHRNGPGQPGDVVMLTIADGDTLDLGLAPHGRGSWRLQITISRRAMPRATSGFLGAGLWLPLLVGDLVLF